MQAQDKTERILQSLDDTERIKVPDFFYARLMARIEKRTGVEKPVFILFRPVFLAACMTLLVVVNSAVLLSRQHYPATFTQGSTASGIENFANDYNLSVSGQLYE